MFGNPIGHPRNPHPARTVVVPKAKDRAQLRAGRGQEIEIMGELVDKIKGNLNEAAGKIKQQSDNPETRDEGAAQEIKGKGEQFAGKVKGALGDDI
jgi:uncharacterized protein YjbJ (UPF0337 family)